MKKGFALSIAVGCTLAASVLRAQTWPQRPVKVIVPYTAGGTTDTQARIISERLSVALTLRRPRRPLPRGLLLGLVFHDARAHRERPHRSREEYARQLCSPDRNGGAHSERQPDVLSQP